MSEHGMARQGCPKNILNAWYAERRGWHRLELTSATVSKFASISTKLRLPRVTSSTRTVALKFKKGPGKGLVLLGWLSTFHFLCSSNMTQRADVPCTSRPWWRP